MRGQIIDYTIVNGEDANAMVEDAVEKLAEGWEPLGGCMPNNYTEWFWDPGGSDERIPQTYTVYTQTWVKRELTDKEK